MDAEDRLYSLAFDASAITRKVDELVEALQVNFPEGVSNHVRTYLSAMLYDIVVGYESTTIDAGGINKILVSLDFGDGFEDFIAALRAGKINDVIHGYGTPLANMSKSGK
ncbi:MAG: hypothetical protein ACYDCD_02630 [Candidatus Acidiferrales bacterium]